MLERPVTGRLAIEPMRRRHVGQILAIEQRVVPASRGRARCSTTSCDQVGAGHRYVPRRPARPDGRRLRRADVRAPTRPTSRTSPCTPTTGAHGIATRLLLALARRGDRRAAARRGRSRCAPAATGAQELYRGFGFAPAGVRAKYYEDDRGRDRHVVPRHPAPPSTPRLASGSCREPVPGDAGRRWLTRSSTTDRRVTVGPDTLVLGIETSCDETAAGARDGRQRRRCRASSARRSSCTPRSAASCPRSPAGPTSSCSTR